MVSRRRQTIQSGERARKARPSGRLQLLQGVDETVVGVRIRPEGDVWRVFPAHMAQLHDVEQTLEEGAEVLVPEEIKKGILVQKAPRSDLLTFTEGAVGGREDVQYQDPVDVQGPVHLLQRQPRSSDLGQGVDAEAQGELLGSQRKVLEAPQDHRRQGEWREGLESLGGATQARRGDVDEREPVARLRQRDRVAPSPEPKSAIDRTPFKWGARAKATYEGDSSPQAASVPSSR